MDKGVESGNVNERTHDSVYVPSTTHILDLLARVSGILLGDPLSDRTRSRQKVLALSTAASALVAISAASLEKLNLFGLTFQAISKQTLTSSLAATCFVMLVLFLLSVYLDFAATRYTRLSAEMETVAAFKTLQLYVDWEQPDRLEFERARMTFARNSYTDLVMRETLAEQIRELSLAEDLETKAAHEKYGSDLYEGVDIVAMNSDDFEVSIRERNKLIERSMSRMNKSPQNVGEASAEAIDERIKRLHEHLERQNQLFEATVAIELKYKELIAPLDDRLRLMPPPDADRLDRLGKELTGFVIDHTTNLALLQSALASSARIKLLAAVIECGVLSLAALVVIGALAWQGWHS